MDKETYSRFEVAHHAHGKEVELTRKCYEVEAKLAGARVYATKLADIHTEMLSELDQARTDTKNNWVEYFKELHNFDYIGIVEKVDNVTEPMEGKSIE